MNRSKKLVAFLTTELQARGIKAVPPQAAGDFAWSMARDDFGFTVVADLAAHGELKEALNSALGDPRFESLENLIFRADERQTTVMLNRNEESTTLILLDWRDRETRCEMESRVEDAMAHILETAAEEMQDLVTQLERSENDEDRHAATQELRQKVEELQDAIEVLRSGGCD